MRSTLVYDLPTRIFHWLFSGLFLVAFGIAKTIDDDSIIFSYHMLAGFLIGGLVIWRIFWGFFGSSHARFTGFNLNPLALKDYFLGILSGSKKRWSGHNPASSWAAITMFVLALGLATSGYLMGTGYKESLEDIHEFMANAFVVIVVMHVAGVLLHSIRHQDAIACSMVDGKKELGNNDQSIPSNRNFSAILLLALFVSAGIYLVNNFDSPNRALNLFGQTLQLGENESNEGVEHDSKSEKSKQSNDDDRDDD